MYRNLLFVAIVVIVSLYTFTHLPQKDPYNLKLEQLSEKFAKKHVPSVVHSKLPALQKEFKTPQEVTEACLSCHTETHKEVMSSSHWNWERVTYVEGRGISSAGKKNVMNNFCLGSTSNEAACAKCHIGLGLSGDHLDLNNARNVDCMVCHDNSDEYLKGSSMGGAPDRMVNLMKVAQSVGMPTKTNCGSCHFYSGGGNNVKHGDLESAQLSCNRDVDVHMATNGLNMECVACHTAENHQIIGKLYSVSGDNTNRATCEQCHTSTPHSNEILNRHDSRVACQTCHIPQYAKANSTKMEWKWSDAGKLKNGEPYDEVDSLGDHTYMSIKGSFVWARNVAPDYVWFNGTADQYKLGDSIQSIPVEMITLNGSATDGKSKIIPVKIHRGDQIYDEKYNRLVQPKLYSPNKGDSAYWMDYDWPKAVAAGMRHAGIPVSGKYGFVKTEAYWPVNHMVAPKEQAVSCAECHTRENGRLAKLGGFYMPGRDSNRWLDRLGLMLFLFSGIGVVVHGILRFLSGKSKKMEPETLVIDSENEPTENISES